VHLKKYNSDENTSNALHASLDPQIIQILCQKTETGRESLSWRFIGALL